MNDRQLDLGVVTRVQVEAFGEPGQRTFRLLVETAEGQASVWLEKEQVLMLGSAIEELLERVGDDAGAAPMEPQLGSFQGELDVKAGSLAIGYDANRLRFSVQAGDFYETPFDIEVLSFLVGRSEILSISDEIGDIVAAGRPRCVLCGTPLTEGPHFCPESNGHSETIMPD